MRALARWGITPLLAAPVGAWALGLGNIELKSALNQPFQAQIEVVSATPDELQGLEGRPGPVRDVRPLRSRPPGVPAEPGVSRRFRSQWSRRRAGHVRPVDHRTVRDVARRSHLAAWPRAARVHGVARSAGPVAGARHAASRAARRDAAGHQQLFGRCDQSSGAATAGSTAGNRARAAGCAATRVAYGARTRGTGIALGCAACAASVAGGAYGPVQRGDTLWVIADRFRPEGVTINQMMVAMYRSNPDAFGGNINLLRAGASLQLPQPPISISSRVPPPTPRCSVRPTSGRRAARPVGSCVCCLLPRPKSHARRRRRRRASRAPERGRLAPSRATRTRPPVRPRAPRLRRLPRASGRSRSTAPRLQNLQQQAAPQLRRCATRRPRPVALPVSISRRNRYSPTTSRRPRPRRERRPPAPPAAACTCTRRDRTVPAVAGARLGHVAAALDRPRRRGAAADRPLVRPSPASGAAEPEGITGRWEQLESEVDDDQVRETTERMRRQLPEQTIVVEEQRPERAQRAEADEERRPSAKPARATPAAASAATPPVEETLSNQTVINLDQADAVAEADFHMAYGLYDQAAELVQKALEASPNRRDLKLKLLEVFFVWGNKDSFLKAAQNLRSEIGQGADADWDKVVIMGRQICPGEKLFTDAMSAADRVDVDLEAGDSPLDLAFDEMPESGTDSAMDDVGAALDFNLETSDERPAPKVAPAKPAAKPIPARDLGNDALDIGAQTAAGLEAALFAPDEEVGRRRRIGHRRRRRRPLDHARVPDDRASASGGFEFLRRRADRRDADDRKSGDRLVYVGRDGRNAVPSQRAADRGATGVGRGSTIHGRDRPRRPRSRREGHRRIAAGPR